MKVCSKCGESKPLTAFYVNRRTPTGRVSACKACMEAGYQNRGRLWITTNVSNAKKRAAKHGVPFDPHAVRDALLGAGTHCPVLGVEYQIGGHGHQGPAANSPTVDRMRPELGYVRGNLVVMSRRANMIKTDASAAELRAVLEWMERS